MPKTFFLYFFCGWWRAMHAFGNKNSSDCGCGCRQQTKRAERNRLLSHQKKTRVELEKRSPVHDRSKRVPWVLLLNSRVRKEIPTDFPIFRRTREKEKKKCRIIYEHFGQRKFYHTINK